MMGQGMNPDKKRTEFFFNFVNAPFERVFREFMADNEKA
jgi:hypothetical protein